MPIIKLLVLVWIATCLRLCWRLRFLAGSHVLFTGLLSMGKYKSNFKTRSHGTIYTFKNYFVTVFSVFKNKRYSNRPLITRLKLGQG